MTLSHRQRQRLTLIGVFAVFMLPILLALALNLPGVSWRPFGVRNHGDLLQPPPSLSDLALQAIDGGSLAERPLTGEWTVLLTAAAPCDERCQSAIDSLHRVQLSLGEHGGRVQLLWLALGDAAPQAGFLTGLRAQNPNLRVARPVLVDLPDVLRAQDPDRAAYVVDPRGFLILRYPPGFDANGLLKDLKRLLRYAKDP